MNIHDNSSTCCVFALDDNYIIPFKVFFNSLSTTGSIPSEVSIVIIHSDTLSNQSKDEITNFLERYSKYPEYFNANDLLPANLPLREGDHVSDATFYRLFIADLLPSKWDKAVYLDVDMIAVNNVSYVFNTEVESMIAAADHLAPEEGMRLWGKTGGSYFQAGVLVIPLTKWRNSNISNKFIKILNEYSSSIRFWDQDVLNLAFQEKWDRLPIWSNISWASMRFIAQEDLIQKTDIRHWAGPDKPWNSIGQYPFVDLWDKHYHEVLRMPFRRNDFQLKRPPLVKRLIPALKTRLKYLFTGKQ